MAYGVKREFTVPMQDDPRQLPFTGHNPHHAGLLAKGENSGRMSRRELMCHSESDFRNHYGFFTGGRRDTQLIGDSTGDLDDQDEKNLNPYGGCSGWRRRGLYIGPCGAPYLAQFEPCANVVP